MLTLFVAIATATPTPAQLVKEDDALARSPASPLVPLALRPRPHAEPCSAEECRAQLPKMAPSAERLLRLVRDSVSGVLGAAYTGSCFNGPRGVGLECPKDRMPYREHARRRGNDWPPFGLTMQGTIRLDNLRSAIESAIASGVPGHVAEFGVWRGGACVFARAVLNEYGASERKVLVFDAFDRIANYGNNSAFLQVHLRDVRQNFADYGLLDAELVEIYPGLFKETVHKYALQAKLRGERIAVLRVDGNFYESYHSVMHAMWDLVPAGGIVIFDDALHPPIKLFWNDFRKEKGLTEELVLIDEHSAWFRKQK